MAACCCCTCTQLQALIDCNAITIEGYSLLGGWQNMTPYTDACCWRGTFAKDDCEGGFLCQESNCSTFGMTGIVTSKRGVDSTQYLGCLREVWIWRDFYSTRWANQNLILDCNDQLGCSYFILTRWVDYFTYNTWFQSRGPMSGDVTDESNYPPFLPTCPFACDVTCEWTEKDDIDYFCYNCNCATDWWRIKHFRQLPTGTVTFEQTDNDPCDTEFLRCVPLRVPGFPEFGKIAHFNRNSRCCGGANNLITITCDDCGILPIFLCDPLTPGWNNIAPLCFEEPEAWSIEIGECE
jgi:hypothetical protein